jgi:hypothetical protein
MSLTSLRPSITRVQTRLSSKARSPASSTYTSKVGEDWSRRMWHICHASSIVDWLETVLDRVLDRVLDSNSPQPIGHLLARRVSNTAGMWLYLVSKYSWNTHWSVLKFLHTKYLRFSRPKYPFYFLIRQFNGYFLYKYYSYSTMVNFNTLQNIFQEYFDAKYNHMPVVKHAGICKSRDCHDHSDASHHSNFLLL